LGRFLTVVAQAFRHEAFFYSGEDQFLDRIVAFIREGVEGDEPVMVATDEAKIRAIKAVLDVDGEQVRFADMAELGRNPARIIPAWRDFVADGAGRPVRGVGEPIWPGRTTAELAECHLHEALLNVAFADAPAFWLLCPYDAAGLEAGVLDEARCTHPHVGERDSSEQSVDYAPLAAPFAGDLPSPPADAHRMAFSHHDLRDVRCFAAEHGTAAGLEPDRRADLVLALSEVATNSVLHAGGGGTVRLWVEDSTLLCEVRDAGRIAEPLVGRERPTVDRATGRGLWLVNHLCDLVQIRSLPSGNVIRLHMSLR
jgi:anti-sigma regulatory factor (Ser/Thr protein kinase)